MQPVKASDSAFDRDWQNLIYDVTELRSGTERIYVAGTRFQIRVTASEAEVPFTNFFRSDSYLFTQTLYIKERAIARIIIIDFNCQNIWSG